MRYASYYAVVLGLTLLISGTALSANAQVPTGITLEVSPSRLHVNEIVNFSGSLVNANTGIGLEGKTVTIFREGPIGPERFLTTVTGVNGLFNVQWTTTLATNRNTPITVFAQFDGDSSALPSRTDKSTFNVTLKPLELVLTTDGNKNRYQIGDRAIISVAFTDGSANFVDPDFVRATYDGRFVEMKKVADGRYTFETPRLVKFERHQFGVFAEKWGFTSAQQSVTITVFGTHDYQPIKVSALKKGDVMRIIVRNSDLSPGNIYTFVGTLFGGVPRDTMTPNWQFTMDRATNSFTLKTLEGFVEPGKMSIIRINVDGTPSTLVWKAFDLHGREHTTVRGLVASGSTSVAVVRL